MPVRDFPHLEIDGDVVPLYEVSGRLKVHGDVSHCLGERRIEPEDSDSAEEERPQQKSDVDPTVARVVAPSVGYVGCFAHL